MLSLTPLSSFGEIFTLEKGKNNKIILKTEELTVTISNCSNFNITTKSKEYKISAYNRKAPVVTEKITIIKDDEKTKKIEISSKPFSVKEDIRMFKLSLETRKNSPGVLFIESEVVNLSDHPSDCYFSWSIEPLNSVMYISEDGDTTITTSKREGISEKWIFFPEADAKGGFGIIINSPNIVMRYHNTDSWLIQGNIPKTIGFKSIEKEQSNKINFIFLSAENEKDIEKYYKSLQGEKE